MIYSVHTYTVEKPRPFVLAFRDAGLWHFLARRRFPGYIATSVLRSHVCSSQWLVIHFWTSAEAHAKAVESPTMATLETLTHELTQDTHDLGVFTFQPRVEEDDDLLDAFPSMAAPIAG